MMVDFNKVGYSGSGTSRDIMDVWDKHSRPRPSEDFYSSNYNSDTSLSGAFAKADPIYGDQTQTFNQAAADQEAPKESLMEKMYPGKDYGGPKVETNTLKRDASKVVTDGAVVSRKANMAMEDTKEQIQTFKDDFKQARKEALDAMKESAQSMDIPLDQAFDSLVPDGSAGKAQAAMYLGLELSTQGLGSMVTAPGKAAYVSQELSKEDKKLSPEQQKALLEDMSKNLQASRAAPADTRAEGGSAPSVPTDTKAEEIAWENMEADDLKELLAADPEGEDQPELEQLMTLEEDLDEVLDNHRFVSEHYHEMGDLVQKGIALEATDQSHAVKETLNEATVAVDAPAVELASQSLNGIVRLDTNATTIDQVVFASVDDISTKVDDSKLDHDILAHELQQHMAREIAPGMGSI